MTKWNVKYSWRGETFNGGQHPTKRAAIAEWRLFIADGWRCWVEPVR